MTAEQLDQAIELQARIKDYTFEIERLENVLIAYSKDEQSFEGIRLYSRLHTSIDLSAKYISIDEVLHTYISRLKIKLSDLKQELSNLIAPPIVEEPVKKKRKLW